MRSLLLLLLLLILCRVGVGVDHGLNNLPNGTTVGLHCRVAERDALLFFRSRLYDPTSRLPPWPKHQDCCMWEGVRCNTRTGRVAALDLRNPYVDEYGYPESNRSLGGVLTPSLVALERLAYLDLSGNPLLWHSIPTFLGSFRRLRYLNLSYTGFTGRVPPEIGNLSRLTHLDLSYKSIYEPLLDVDDERWISGLSSLQVLDLSGVRFTKAAPSSWIQSLNMLPSIREIKLFDCSLTSMIIPPSHGGGHDRHVNLTSLTRLNLSQNRFTSTIPSWLLHVTSLEHLDLSFNAFSAGTIPYGVGNLTSLKYLYLSSNNLTGPIPVSIGGLSNLVYLDLSRNKLSGPIPVSIGGLSNLTYLDLGFNKLSWTVAGGGDRLSESLGRLTNLTHLDLSWNNLSGSILMSIGKLSNLTYLILSSNHLSGPIPVNIGGLSSLTNLQLSYNNLSGPIPASICGLSNLTYLDLSRNKLRGAIPVCIGRLSKLNVLDLSENSLGGVLTEAHFANLTNLEDLDISGNSFSLKVRPHWNPPFRLESINMGGCKLGPQFPAWLRTQDNYMFMVDMSHAGISDMVPEWFWNLSAPIERLDLSHNNISGPLQFVASNLTRVIDLSHNLFSGTILASIADTASSLWYLKLSTNNLTGNIPNSLCELTQLQLIDLSQNRLNGKIPAGCWDSASGLKVLDLSNNNLSDQIPISMCSTRSQLMFFSVSNNNISGDIPPSLSKCENMKVFDAANNMLSGSVPSQLSQLPSLHILNLSKNNLSGSIPNNFGNFTGMMQNVQSYDGFDINLGEINEQMYSKGRELTYTNNILALLVNLDISDNSLSENIPSELGNLIGLHGLSLSGNHLTGHIPKEIGVLQSLESLDLSRNNLSGEIPSTLAELTSLSWLNLSYNNLSGMIPNGNQLQTFDDMSYTGNLYLCGFPLTKACQGNKTIHQGQITIEDEGSDVMWLYAGLAPGFAVGISIIWGLLLLHRSLRIAYFRFIQNIYDNIYVMLIVGRERLKRKFLHQN